MNKAKVLIAIPNLGSIHPLLVMKLLQWSTSPTKGVEQVSVILPLNQIPHDSARNFCVKHFLTTDSTHLFFLDNDVTPPADTLEKLIEADKDAITGLYPSMKLDPYSNQAVKRYNVFRYGEDDHGGYGLIHAFDEGVKKIDHCGGGCLLIKREVLEKVPAPWFKFHYTEDGIMNWGEDIDFGKKLKEAGFELFGHFDVKCNHFKEIML